MQTTNLGGLLAGLLLIMASFLMPTSKAPNLTLASTADLASVYGMDYQGTPSRTTPPRTWLGLVCQQYGGTLCDEDAASNPRTYCGGLWPDAGPCGGAAGRHCRRKIDGPSNHDACTTSGAQPTSSCTLHYDGYCVKYQVGKCATDAGLLSCYCDYSGGGTFTSGTRQYCQ